MKFFKRFHWFELTLIAVILGFSLYSAFSAPHNFSTRWFVRDDAYYYFKVAQNISEGHGSTFDGINLANGYHPLWMLVCIPIFALARFDLILPLRILLVVMALLNAATAVLLFRLLKKLISEPVAMLAAAYWAFDLTIHDIVTQPGMETGIVALSIVLLLNLLQNAEQKNRRTPLTHIDILWLSLAAILILFSRLDSVYLALLAGIWIIFRGTPIRYLLPADLLATFAVVILAYLQRAGLETYLLVYANSAIIAAAVTFIVQTVVFYFAGLYSHPKGQSLRALFVQTIVGATASALITAIALFGLSALHLAEVPRAVPLIYWAGTLLVTFILRLGLGTLSPWPVSPSNPAASPSESITAGLASPKPTLGLISFPWLDFKTPWLNLKANFSIWLREGVCYYGPLGGALGVYMLFNLWMFGTPMPVSGQIKRWWGSLPNDVYGGSTKSVADLFGLDPNYSKAWGLLTDRLYPLADKLQATSATIELPTIFWGLLLGISLVWLALFLARRSKNVVRIFQTGLIPLLVSAELHVFMYGAMAYAAKHEWYWTMQMLALVILAAIGLSSLLELLLARKMVNSLAWLGASGLSLALVATFAVSLYDRMPYKDPLADQPYMDMLPILEGYTEPGSLIGMTGGGNAGYFIKDRTVVNMDGLINSYAYFQAVKAEKGGEFLDKMGLDYAFGNKYILQNTMPYRPQFKDHLLEMPMVPQYGRKELLKFAPSSAIKP